MDLRLSSIEVTGYGPFVDCKIVVPPEARVVLFEGPNGSGKTSLIEALAFALDPQALLSGRRYSGQGRSSVMGAPAERVGARQARNASLRVVMRSVEGATVDIPAFDKPVQALGSSMLWGPRFEWDGMESWACFAYRAHIPPPTLRADAEVTRWSPEVGCLSFGAVADDRAAQRLGALVRNSRLQELLYMQQASEAADELGRAQALERARAHAELPRRISEALSRVLDQPVMIGMEAGDTAPVFRLRGVRVDPELLGEGIRSTFAWLSDLLIRLQHWPWPKADVPPTDRPFMLLLDEVDESLHPQLQMRLYPALQQLFPKAVIIASTHSPFVVASIAHGVVFPLRPGDDGVVRGTIEPRALRPGSSLELITADVFRTAFELLDPESSSAVQQYERAVAAYLRAKSKENLEQVVRQRRLLFDMNRDLALKVDLIEAPVRRELNAALASGDDAA